MKVNRYSSQSNSVLYTFSWAVVAYTILIVVWGAWVRISGSGDGCGDHWPLCNGQLVPLQARAKTWVEFSHRLSTGLYGIFVVMQIFLVRRVFSGPHPARTWSALTVFFTITEALIGRQLVTMGLVNESVALARVVVMPLHLVNTAFLLGCAVMTAEAIKYGHIPRADLPPLMRRLLTILVATLLTLLTTGAVAALGAHLAPSSSIVAGFAKDLSADSHLAVRLRALHPLLALLGPLALYVVLEKLRDNAPSPLARAMFGRLSLALGAAVLVGVCTLLTLAPTWLKMSHLFMANILIVMTTLCVFHTLRPSPK
jgi:cytochrome c oxidase assembly protein subunit 15